MTHLTTRGVGEDLELLYQVPDHEHFQYLLRRTAVGVGFPEAVDYSQGSYAYACVVGERVWWPIEEGSQPERQFVVLDEVEATDSSDLFASVAVLKDRYLASVVFCPNSPRTMVDALRRMPGLTHYPGDPPALLRQRFPTYVSRETVAGIRDVDTGDVETMRRDLNRFLDAELHYPSSDLPIFSSQGREPVRKLIVLQSGDNFSTAIANQGIHRSEPKHIAPIWLAANGLERSMSWSEVGKVGHQWKGSQVTGY
jgi:hypothetical protein